MGQEHMTSGDNCRHQAGIWRKRASDLCVCGVGREGAVGMPPPSPSLIGYELFLVAVTPAGEENLIVLPSTTPAYLVLPAVKVISLPRSRP